MQREDSDPSANLVLAYTKASQQMKQSFFKDKKLAEKVEFVCRCYSNRAGVRLLLACGLAKVHRPDIDIRKPYTEIGDKDSYSGRKYDESYVTEFINKYKLPCNPTTAFLTPAFRTGNMILKVGIDLVGRPKQLYDYTLELLDMVQKGKITAFDLICETVQYLLIVKETKEERLRSLLSEIKHSSDTIQLSSEDIINLIQQHLQCRGASRLPVLVVAAAYKSAEKYIQEQVLPLQAHNAADEQTGALGDVEVTLINDDKIVTCYEMKMRPVTKEDIDRAIQKISKSKIKIDNYIFITTEVIESSIAEYAKALYAQTSGIEFVILDCLQFIRHFLHFFHRIRIQYLEAYQELLLSQSESSVSHPLKEAFLTLRITAENSYIS